MLLRALFLLKCYRARAKSVLKVTGAELVAKQDWNMTLETNSKQSVATVTLLLKQKDPNSSSDNK